MSDTRLDEIAGDLADGLRGSLGGRNARLFVTLKRLLVNGRPVRHEQVAEMLGIPRGEVEAALRQLPSVEYDRDGNLVGSGLTLNPTPHRFEVDGRELFTWCALDTLFFPAILAQTARVSSSCHASGDEIHLTIRPDGVEDLTPPGAVVSIVVPEAEEACCDVRGAFCNDVHYFRSSGDASEWLSAHPDGIVLSVDEAFEVGRGVVELLFRATLDLMGTTV
ncbi:MAG: organomercurial lyase MerB [Planctomycetota bacterium]|nr:MAG: organomercurial lyase MerB [Planctomycetota bacterium]